MGANANRFTVGFEGRTPDGDHAGTVSGENFGTRRFTGMQALLTGLEAMMDAQNYPQAATKTRTFRKCKKRESEVDAVMDRKKQDPSEEKLNKATFVVTVMYRQNATWQGTVKWLEAGTEEKFRSALELIKLMDGAVEQAEESLPKL